MKRSIASLVVIAACAVLGAASPAAASAQGALIIRFGPEAGCEIGPTDIPGVAVDIPADCLVVATPSGNALVRVRGQIPSGFALTETFVSGEVPCGFPGLGFGRGVLVATTSGQVTAHCHIRAEA
jgi:hypothetical protein